MRRSAHHFATQNIICVSRHHAAGASFFKKSPTNTKTRLAAGFCV
jgi:hypothetical protein